MGFDPRVPNNDLPPLPPAVDVETKPVLRAAIAARVALVELNSLTRLLPNPDLLISGIVLQEARSSSEIENIVTTDDELYRAASEDGAGADALTKEILRYRKALWAGADGLKERPISMNLFIEIASVIKGKDMPVRRTPGTRLSGPGGVVYTPPEAGPTVLKKLGELEGYVHDDDGLDPLVRMALIHYQFEAIHPFTDGNGRTGRIINLLYLVERGLLDRPVLFLSGFILRNRPEYYRLLRGVTESGDWEPWVLYILRAVLETSLDTTARIRRIVALIEEMAVLLRERARKIYSRELVEVVFGLPYSKSRFVEKACGVSRPTAIKYLNQLAEMQVVGVQSVGQDRYFVNQRLIEILSSPADVHVE